MARAEYQVSLESADNGIIVRVGCKTLIVHDDKIDEAFIDLKRLLTGGWEGQREVRKKWLNDIDEVDCVPQKTGTAAIPQPVDR